MERPRRSQPPRAGLVLLGLCWPLWVGCVAAVEVDVQNVAITWRGVAFDAVPTVLPSGLLAASRACPLSSSNIAWAKQLDANVRAMSVRLHGADGIANLDFIQTAIATVTTAKDPARAIQIMAYQRPAGAASSAEVEARNAEPIDVSEIWSERDALVNLLVAGQLPATPWTVDLTVNVSGQIEGRL